MTDLRVVVTGASGRMGRSLIKAVTATPGCVLAGAVERRGASEIGGDAGLLAGLGPLGVVVSDDPLATFLHADAVLDFTAPAATVEFAALCAQVRIVHVVGTTGLSEGDFAALRAAARHAVLIQSGNMSLGVNLLAALVKKAAAALDPTFDIEIVEMHHRMKVDAPSGTALLLGEAAAAGRGNAGLKEVRIPAREGHTGARPADGIGFAALRGGSVIGDHTVILAGNGERIELRHIAEDRSLFAAGAVKAALWGHGRRPGFYSMADVLEL